jgi:hypothetical protein
MIKKQHVMKKAIICAMALFAGVQTMSAEDYKFLTFETTDGTKASVDASSLTMTLSGNTLKAGEETFVVSNLSKMYFSVTDETTTGIEEISINALDGSIEVFDLGGRKVAKEQMRNGVYIVRTKNGTCKIKVKK